MAILIEIKKENRVPKPIGSLDASIPGAQEIADSIANGYNQLFSDTSMLTLYNQIISGIIKQVQTHEHLRAEKEKRGIK